MNFKKIFQNSIFILLALFSMPLSILAYSEYVLPGGQNIGIELHSNGILIVGLYEVNGEYPGKTAGLKVGDTIQKVNDQEVSSIDEMVKVINTQADTGKVKIEYKRNQKTLTTVLNIYQDENQIYKTGLYVKDSITGIGTLTYIDPNTKLFGALGHEILEKTTGKILEIKDGKIYDSIVTSITKSENGVPGEKNAKFDSKSTEGTIKENTVHGIFGTYSNPLPDTKLYKVASPSQVKTGEAVIRTVLNGTEIKEYQINITKINDSESTKNISFTITDQELLNTTGGIIQGMSGSPILQGEYLIGAVTHVVVDSPNRGYGIFITNMLEESEN